MAQFDSREKKAKQFKIGETKTSTSRGAKTMSYKEYILRIHNNGNREYLNKAGQRHREDGPAYEHANGSKFWFINGQLHREDGPACEYADGSKYWYINDKLHREDGPACEWAEGDKFWYINGQLHREDGPARERANGSKSWWINGKSLTEAEFLARTRKANCDGKVVEIEGKKYRLVAE